LKDQLSRTDTHLRNLHKTLASDCLNLHDGLMKELHSGTARFVDFDVESHIEYQLNESDPEYVEGEANILATREGPWMDKGMTALAVVHENIDDEDWSSHGDERMPGKDG